MITTQMRIDADIAILDLEGTLDGGPACKRIQALVKEILQDGTKKVLLNLSSVPWANSLGVGVLIASYVSATREHATLKFCGVSHRIDMVLRAADLVPGVFETFDSEEEALQSFSQPSSLGQDRP